MHQDVVRIAAINHHSRSTRSGPKVVMMLAPSSVSCSQQASERTPCGKEWGNFVHLHQGIFIEKGPFFLGKWGLASLASRKHPPSTSPPPLSWETPLLRLSIKPDPPLL